MIRTFVEGKDKLIAPKLNNFLMHVGYQKCKVSMLGVDACACYMNTIMCIPRMKGNSLLVKDFLFWTYSNVIFPLNTNGSMSNLLLFITSLLMVIQ